jgi:hypothetical protein
MAAAPACRGPWSWFYEMLPAYRTEFAALCKAEAELSAKGNKDAEIEGNRLVGDFLHKYAALVLNYISDRGLFDAEKFAVTSPKTRIVALYFLERVDARAAFFQDRNPPLSQSVKK